MSTIIMSACWPLGGMSPSQKAVLISLADNANDHGVCWPSIPTIAKRTCLSERTVQQAIKWLVDAGAVSAQERVGRSTVYTVTPHLFDPRSSFTPAAAAPPKLTAQPPQLTTEPPQQLHPTPAAAAPITVKEPSKNHQEPSSKKFDPVNRLLSVGVSPEVADDWLELRKQKKATVTETAIRGIEREAQKAGIPLGEALAVSCMRGWIGFKADWYTKDAGTAATGRRGLVL